MWGLSSINQVPSIGFAFQSISKPPLPFPFQRPIVKNASSRNGVVRDQLCRISRANRDEMTQVVKVTRTRPSILQATKSLYKALLPGLRAYRYRTITCTIQRGSKDEK